MYTYTWKDNARTAADAQVVGSALHDLAQELGRPFDGLTANDVVEAAHNPLSVLHNFFEWDEATAAQEHRKYQARWILRSIRIQVVSSNEDRQSIAYVNVKVENQPLYVPTTLASHNISLRQQMLADARRGLQGWVRRYEHLSEISEALEVVRSALVFIDKEVEVQQDQVALNNTTALLAQVGQASIDGIIYDTQGQQTALNQATVDALNQAQEQAEQALDIHSPSIIYKKMR